jgi:hypothetical protein
LSSAFSRGVCVSTCVEVLVEVLQDLFLASDHLIIDE